MPKRPYSEWFAIAGEVMAILERHGVTPAEVAAVWDELKGLFGR